MDGIIRNSLDVAAMAGGLGGTAAWDDSTKTYLTNEQLSLQMSNNDVRCDQCGVTFTTAQDREEHMKLEHKENKGPSGVR